MSGWDDLLTDGYAGKLPTLPSLQLACGFTDAEAAAFCLVSPETFRRWRCDRPPNRTALRLLAIRAGLLPWPLWHGWQVHDGRLMAPHQTRGGWTPGDLLAAPLWAEVAKDQARELVELRAELDTLRQAIRWTSPGRRRA